MPRVLALGLAVIIGALALFAPASAWAAPKEVRSVDASCTGDSLSGTISLRNFPSGSQIVLTLQRQDSGWSDTTVQQLVTTVPGVNEYAYALNVSAHKDAKAWRVRADDVSSGTSKTSGRVAVSSCAPPAQLPEAPIAILLPASMLLTAAAWFGLRRREAVGSQSAF